MHDTVELAVAGGGIPQQRCNVSGIARARLNNEITPFLQFFGQVIGKLRRISVLVRQQYPATWLRLTG